MLMDGGAQCTGAVAVDQIDHRLSVQDSAVNKGIHLRQCLIHRKSKQIAFHFGGALYALYPAVGTVGIAGQAGISLLRLGLGRGGLFYQLFRLLQALERYLGLDDTGTHQHIAVFVRQCQNSGQLVQLCNADLLPYFYLLQRHKLLNGIMHHLCTGKQLFGFLFGNFAGTLCLLLGAHTLVLLQLAQFIGQRVGLCFHLLCQRARLGTGSLQFIFALLDQLIPLFAGGFQLMGGFVAQLLHFVLAFLQLKLQIVQLPQNCIQTLILRRQMLLSGLNDAAGDAKFFADQECVGFARYAHTQLIGGAQGLQIKLTAGVDHALRLQCKNLQLRIVGGSHQQYTTAAQLLNDGNCQRGTLGGVGACAQLVQQHKGVRHGQFQNAGDLFHVAGEGGKALLNALFIADIYQKFIKHTDLTALVSRDQKAALCHSA